MIATCLPRSPCCVCIQLNNDYTLSLSSLMSLLSQKTKLVALSHTSNVLGSFNPYLPSAVAMIKQHSRKTVVLLDATQALAHSPVSSDEFSSRVAPPPFSHSRPRLPDGLETVSHSRTHTSRSMQLPAHLWVYCCGASRRVPHTSPSEIPV